MVNIALLQNIDTTERIFTEAQVNKLRTMGKVTINQSREAVTAEQVKTIMKDADIAITSWGCPKLDEEMLCVAPNLKVVMHAAGTVKGIVSPELWQKGIRVTSTAEALGKGVAETALGLTIVSLKNLWVLAENTRQGKWHEDKDKVRELYGITVGVIGAGRAGQHYIRLLQGFDVEVLLYDPVVTEEQAQTMGATKVELEQLLSQSDVVSIHAPSVPATHKMINQTTLSIMKDDAVLINTARGTIIDETALVEELEKGRLFACLDVTDPEPPSSDHPFRSLPNVILTPHIAGAVNNGLHRIADLIITDLQRYLSGDSMSGEVDPAILNQLA